MSEKFRNPTIFHSIGISRLRMTTDGEGITTLVGGVGCPLRCKYCLNPQCHGDVDKSYTVEELFDVVKSDSLYFEATGGGVTFGGGEPLLQAGFIREFIDFVRNNGHNWQFYIETSLAVEWTKVALLADEIDEWIVDLKDADEWTYFAYTGMSGKTARDNLTRLAVICPEKIRVRLPLIPGFNSMESLDLSHNFVRGLGIGQVERFEYSVIHQ